jgi:hypothetical protein
MRSLGFSAAAIFRDDQSPGRLAYSSPAEGDPIMFRTTLVPLLTVTCLALSAGTASAQNLLNPFTWFGPQAGYGYNSASCPNGQCGTQTGYCPGGNCNRPGSCANGQCGLPNNCPNGICPTTPNYGGYTPNYRSMPYGNNAPYGTNAPYSNNAPYAAPRYNAPSQYAPYSAQRPVTRSPIYDRSVTPVGGFDGNTPTTARRNYGPSNSPFYP